MGRPATACSDCRHYVRSHRGGPPTYGWCAQRKEPTYASCSGAECDNYEAGEHSRECKARAFDRDREQWLEEQVESLSRLNEEWGTKEGELYDRIAELEVEVERLRKEISWVLENQDATHADQMKVLRAAILDDEPITDYGLELAWKETEWEILKRQSVIDEAIRYVKETLKMNRVAMEEDCVVLFKDVLNILQSDMVESRSEKQ